MNYQNSNSDILEEFNTFTEKNLHLVKTHVRNNLSQEIYNPLKEST